MELSAAVFKINRLLVDGAIVKPFSKVKLPAAEVKVVVPLTVAVPAVEET